MPRPVNVQLTQGFQKIADTCAYCGINVAPRGFLWPNQVENTYVSNLLLCWFPKTSHNWNNSLNAKGDVWEEQPSSANRLSDTQHLNQWVNTNMRKAVFLRNNNRFHDHLYHFVGIFEFNKQASLAAGHCVWHRVAIKLSYTIP